MVLLNHVEHNCQGPEAAVLLALLDEQHGERTGSRRPAGSLAWHKLPLQPHPLLGKVTPAVFFMSVAL